MEARLLNDEIHNQIMELFKAELINPVELIYFSKQEECDTCQETLQLVMELVELSPLLNVNVYDIDEHTQLARQYHIDYAPGLVIAGKELGKYVDYGIRFLGIPSGYEFSSLIHSIGLVSRRDSGLKPEIRKEINALTTPVNLKVFVTPTCPYCPQAVLLAYQIAMENPLIQAEMVEANEFYELAMEYNVSGVPQTDVNEGAGVIVGAVPEEYLLQEIKRAIAI
jgi:glutaredoxin-like protein